MLSAIYVGEAVCFALLALLASSFSLPLVLALALIDGILMLTARGLSRGAVNAVLRPAGELRAGNGLLNIGFAIAERRRRRPGRPARARRSGWSSALAVDACSFLVIALLMATCRHLSGEHEDREPFLSRLRSGLRHAMRDPITRLLLGGEALAVTLFALIVPIEIVYAQETLGTDDAGYGILLSSWGAGVVLGSVAFVGLKRRSALAADRALHARDRRRLPRHGLHARAPSSRARSPCSAASATASSGCRS